MEANIDKEVSNKIYQVAKNKNLDIREIEYIKKSEIFYWTTPKNREALNTNWVASFDTKEEAVNYLKYLIKKEISLAESTIKYYNEQLEIFNKKFL
jgi:hypothetical protein